MSSDLELRKAFFLESAEILERLGGEIGQMEAKPSDAEAINSVFRSLHTIKGNSSFLSLDHITRISHSAEALLDKARKKEIPVSPGLLRIVRRVLSDLQTMIVDQQTELDVSSQVEAIKRFMAGDAKAAEEMGNRAPSAPSAVKVQTGSFVRVDEARLGKILSITSELELLRHAFEKIPEKMESLGEEGEELRFEVDLQVSKFSRLARSLASLVFGVRLVPVNQVFQRFPKVVSDLAAKLGKEIRLQVMNGSAELDKHIVEAIADPMTHLIRNSADHGIEKASERIKAGKSPIGTIKLNSYVSGNFVIIEIADDGRGIDGHKILKKAVEKGIVPPEKASELGESQRLGLIFAPGFSTAEAVTDISGRGVGMDVVKSNINRLKGTVIIDSKVGAGTVIQLRFPMSMVVLYSLFLDVGGVSCAFPMDQMEESLDYSSMEVLAEIPAGEAKESYCSLFHLGAVLWGQELPPSASRVYHSLRIKGFPAMVFAVDGLQSIQEAIVQSVDSYIAALPGIQGATVRKDGSVSLVLNSRSIVELAKKAKPLGYVKKRSPFIEGRGVPEKASEPFAPDKIA
jgi:two-component system chemotaxis sensor kinase CheA